MALKGARAAGEPRRASDVAAQVVVAGEAGGPYRPGFLALRQGPLLSAAVAALPATPDVMLVDATGLDHPRWAGLAVHLGAVVGLPTVGVTDRALRGVGEKPAAVRGARRPVTVEGRLVGYWVSTRSGARPVLAHAGWRTDAHTAADAVLLASTAASRTPVPLQEARRVAREARALWGTGRPQGDRTGTLDGSPE
jgi:deoxyribonuclease V